jgi:hypothetical protein
LTVICDQIDTCPEEIQVHEAGKGDELAAGASERKGEKELDWIAYDIDPMPLKWVEAPGDEFLVDLAAGMSALAYVGEYHVKSGEARAIHT